MDSVFSVSTSVPIMTTEYLETKQLLYSDENLDRRSPEMWPEQVPGVVNYISGSYPITDIEDDSLQELSTIHQEPQIGGNSCGDSGNCSGSSEAASVKKYSRKFDFTGYGLASSEPERKKHKSGGNSDVEGDSDSEERGSLDDKNCESNENSSRASPVDGLVSNTSVPHPSTSKAISNIFPKLELKPKSPVKTNVPDFQQGLDEEEVAMLYGFSSLSTSALLDKVKDIQNLAYQLGLEEEREMARARFLNVLGDCQASESLISGLFLNKNGEWECKTVKSYTNIDYFHPFLLPDLAFAEAKTLDNSKNVDSMARNSVTNGISLETSNGTSTSDPTSTTTTTTTAIATEKKKSSK